MFLILFIIRPPPELLPVLGRWNGDVMPTLDAALLCSSRAGSNLGRVSGFITHIQSIFVTERSRRW